MWVGMLEREEERERKRAVQGGGGEEGREGGWKGEGGKEECGKNARK